MFFIFLASFGQSAALTGNDPDDGQSHEQMLHSTDSSDRWHTVSAYVGAELSLPCAVDVAGCGRIYFITWTKNVSTIVNAGPELSDNEAGGNSGEQSDFKSSSMSTDQSTTPASKTGSSNNNNNGNNGNAGASEWQRVFIHSDTFERVLGDLEQYGPRNRVRFGPKNLSQTNFAHLSLRTVVPEDEGVYKCDVTYVTPHAHGKCPSLTYIRVQTLGKSYNFKYFLVIFFYQEKGIKKKCFTI